MSLFLLILYVKLIVSLSYNLIETNPSCYQKSICTVYGKPGTKNSIHPNSEERTQYTLRNMARLYPTDYINSKYGKHIYGTFGDQTVFDNEGFCGVATSKPMYWHSDGNQLARFHEWDAEQCASDPGHSTCSDRCYLFNNDCTFSGRADFFVGDDGAVATAEGIWGANMGYEDGHCSAVFNPDYVYHGIGFWPFRNSITSVYITNGPSISYPLVQGAHFDERIKVNNADYDNNDLHLTFMVEYYSEDINSETVYVLFDGAAHSMNRYIGDTSSGFYEIHFDIPTECRPYAFFVITTGGTIYRLPQDERYFFGTAWTDWDWWSPQDDCKENHYYLNDQSKWIPNGSDQVDNNDQCTGCDEIDGLVSIYNTFKVPSPTSTPTIIPTVPPTMIPTYSPISESPTKSPTKSPTIIPTLSPTMRPTSSPIIPGSPTKSPTKSPKMDSTSTEEPNQYEWDSTFTFFYGSNTINVGDTETTQLTNIQNHVESDKAENSTESVWIYVTIVLVLLAAILVCIYFGIRWYKSHKNEFHTESKTKSTIQHHVIIQNEDDTVTTQQISTKSSRPPPPPPPRPRVRVKQNNNYYDGVNDDEYYFEDHVIEYQNNKVSGSNENKQHVTSQITLKYLSIEEAKKVKATKSIGKETYLNDVDFMSVFGMNKLEFYSLKKWKQIHLKKANGFF